MLNSKQSTSQGRRAVRVRRAQTLLLATGALALLAGVGCGGESASAATGTGASTGSGGSPGTGGAGATSTATGTTTATSTGSSASTGTGGAPPDLACKDPPCINVTNNCPFPIWINAVNNPINPPKVTLSPDNAKLSAGGQSGNTQQYHVPADWSAGRINAFWVDPQGPSPDPNAHDKVELTVEGGKMNYNITYVDYVALPVSAEAVGPSCTKSGNFDPKVSCPVKSDAILSSCPDGLLDGKRCLSAGQYCNIAANKAKPYCHALDAAITTCAAQNPATCGVATQLNNTTLNAYECSGYFDSQPANCSPASAACHKDGNKWCAALNRGMLADPESTDTSKYYKNAPYNTYSKWVHDTCPGLYAFPYDDYPSAAGESGFRSCPADRFDITFCPGG